ncbi:hypothetical protein AVEN_18640-2 [Araneus ventricosus]|uniref:Uncharacterized protein n=1 Tax=Araneus ventricosus TaxID=182803 RepID=A0A4Y2MAM0_ARAVE|nr:hypothetical protein AVEN_18640-2 [Araneus ventricosus]
MATWLRKCSGMTQEEVDALSMKIAMKQEQHLIPLKEDLADWLNKTLAGTPHFPLVMFLGSRTGLDQVGLETLLHRCAPPYMH